MKNIAIKLNLPKHDDLKEGETAVRDGIKIERCKDFMFEGKPIKVTIFS